jgi:DNA-binding response OmpR family regulator
MANIVIVEDNVFIREAITGYLQLKEHETHEFGEVNGVLSFAKNHSVDVFILDVMLPDGSGFSLAKSLKEISEAPILFLTAKDSESDRILGFELGADDYVVKPFSTRELVLRVEALLKRCKNKTEVLSDISGWVLDDHLLEIDKPAHRILYMGQELNLTGAEWKILLYLAEREDRVVSRGQILTECLNYLFEGSERTVDTHIANLRNKLSGLEWIGTVRGFGYRFKGARITS